MDMGRLLSNRVEHTRIRKITSHPTAVLLCREQGPPPLQFAELITD